MDSEKVPIEQVIDDMYSDRGPISWAARDYYKSYYADPNEIKQMEREERRETIVAFTILGLIFITAVVVIIAEVIQ